MIKKVVTKRSVKDFHSVKEDLAHWLSKTPEERVEVVEYLRRQLHGSSERLQRTARVITMGRKKDLADIEALGEE